MRACLVLLLSACGFQVAGTGTDAQHPAQDAIDAPGDTGSIDGNVVAPCIANWLNNSVALSPPMLVPGVGSALTSERDPFLSTNELHIYWVSSRGADTDVYVASRAAITDAFGTDAIKTSLSDTNRDDSKVTITGDDLLAIESTQRQGGEGGFDLWQTTRSTGGTAPFGAFTQMSLGTLNDGNDQLDPAISADGLRLYYSAGSPQRILVSTRTTLQDDFPLAVEVPGINGTSGDGDPAISVDERVIVFTSNRTGTSGPSDLWYATRADVGSSFSEPRLVPSVNEIGSDGDPHLSADGCRLYFASSRSGNNDLFLSTLL
jgi:Tol biopolymer transport system component